MARRGRIRRAVIARIAADRRIDLGAAAHRYDSMSITRKRMLCEREEREHHARKAREAAAAAQLRPAARSDPVSGRRLPTLQQVSSLLELKRETGHLLWLVSRPNGVRVGQRAGSLFTKGYRYVSVLGVRIKASHIVWLLDKGEWPVGELDHENRIRDDDRPCNLRPATRSQQVRNRMSVNKTGFRGVAQVTTNCFSARIAQTGKRHHIGCFPTAREAAEAYDAEVVDRFGKGYPTNASLGLYNANPSP